MGQKHRIRPQIWPAVFLLHIFLPIPVVVSFTVSDRSSSISRQHSRITPFLPVSFTLIKHTKRWDNSFCNYIRRGKVNDEDDDDNYYYPPSSSRSASTSKKSRNGNDQRNQFYDSYYEEGYTDKGFDFNYDENQKLARFQSQDNFYEEEDEEEDIYYDEEEEDDQASSLGGNFWSNPKGGIDRSMRPPLAPSPRLTRPRRRPPNTVDPSSTRRRRTPVRSDSMTQAPLAAKDLYERLFWYGFDPDDSDQIGDKTVFGGTKGKFNGLAYLQASEVPRRPIQSRQEQQRQLPPSTRRRPSKYVEDEEDEYYDDGEDDMDFDMYDDEQARDSEARINRPMQSTRTNVTPPEDSPNPRNERTARPKPSRRKRRQRDYDDIYEDDNENASFNGGDWVSKQVSSWFSGTDEDNDDQYNDNSRRRQQRRRQQTEWSPFNVLDAFFGVKRDELAYKAEMYNSKMGIGSKSRSQPRSEASKRERRRQAQRPGYAYRYDPENDDADGEEAAFVVDIEPTTRDNTTFDTGKICETEESTEGTESVSDSGRVKELTWEERALAVERVPPADIPGWGPSGELPFDARTKAIMDALEDIQIARQKLEASEKKEGLAKEEITILKVDAELQRRQLEESRTNVRLAQERLRQIELEIDDASRVLRRARTRVRLARDRLEELQVRHWAVLGFYDPDQAEEKVAEALTAYRLSEGTTRSLDDLSTSTVTQESFERQENPSTADSSTLPKKGETE